MNNIVKKFKLKRKIARHFKLLQGGPIKRYKRDKEYPTTLGGLFESIKDKITGAPTTYESEDELKAIEGTMDFDNYRRKNFAKANEDYLNSPISLMQEAHKRGQTPMVGLSRTVLPALIGAAPFSDQVINGIKSLANPKTYKAAWNFIRSPRKIYKNVVAPIAKGSLGAEAVNGLTRIFADRKDFGEWASPYVGLSPEAAKWLNPGYLMATTPTHIGEHVYNAYLRRRLGNQIENHLIKITPKLDKQLLELANQSDLLKKSLRKLSDKAYFLRDKYYNQLTPQGILNTRELKRVKSANNIAKLEYPNVTFMMNTPSGYLNNLADLTFSFGGQNYTSPVQRVTTYNVGTNVPLRRNTGYAVPLPVGFPIYSGNTKAFQEGVGKYVDFVNNTVGENGVVAGSLVSYRNGVLKGTDVYGSIVGPADTELYTTAKRLPNLQTSLKGFELHKTNSVGGVVGTWPKAFGSGKVEINIIEEKNGKATGKLAHQIYRSLYPKEYAELVNKSILSGNTATPSELPLPVSAEDLLQTLRNKPEALQHLLMTDMFGAETFTRPLNIKHSKRIYSTLFNPDNHAQMRLERALKSVGTYNTNPNFRLGTDLYPNLTFDNIAENSLFLQEVFKLSPEIAERYASNPAIMKNAFNIANYSYSTGVRTTSLMFDPRFKKDIEFELLNTTGNLGGGTGQGPGRNMMLLDPGGGYGVQDNYTTSVTQSLLTYKPEEIRTPMDLLRLTLHLRTPPNSNLISNLLLNISEKGNFIYDVDGANRIAELAKSENRPVFLNGEYIGGLSKPIAGGIRQVRFGDSPELGSLLHDLSNGSLVEYVPAPEETQKGIEEFLNWWKNASRKERGQLLSKGKVDIPTISSVQFPEKLRKPVFGRKTVSKKDYEAYKLDKQKFERFNVWYNRYKKLLNKEQENVELKIILNKNRRNDYYWKDLLYRRYPERANANISVPFFAGTGLLSGLGWAAKSRRKKHQKYIEDDIKHENSNK